MITYLTYSFKTIWLTTYFIFLRMYVINRIYVITLSLNKVFINNTMNLGSGYMVASQYVSFGKLATKFFTFFAANL